MNLCLSPLNEDQGRDILRWQYDPPYDLYSMAAEGDTVELAMLTDPDSHYYAISDERGELLAYCCFGAEGRVPGGNYEMRALDVGVGMRPDLTGQGLGQHYLNAILEFAVRRFSPSTLRVTVAAFNGRALRLCRKAGFQETERFVRKGDGLEFVILVRSAVPEGLPGSA